MFIKLYAIALPIFFAFDMLWLGVIAKNLYKREIGHLMKDVVNWQAAIVFYALFVIGLVFFVITPSIQKGSLMYAILVGALFGFITYATYDLTNLAITKDWPFMITIVDLLWGSALGAIVCGLTYLIYTKFVA